MWAVGQGGVCEQACARREVACPGCYAQAMAQPLMPHPYRRRRSSRWSLPVLAVGVAVAVIWGTELRGYGFAVLFAAIFVGLVLDELENKRAA